MSRIKAPDTADIDIDVSEIDVSGVLRALSIEVRKLVNGYLREIDPSIAEDGINVWMVDPDGNIPDWYHQIPWELLEEEAHVFCSGFAPTDGTEYEADGIAAIKSARDGMAKIVAILDAELSLGKPSAKTMERM